MVHTCPRCDLRFLEMEEVRGHLIDEHGVDPEHLERQYRLPRGIHPYRQAPDPTHVVHSTEE